MARDQKRRPMTDAEIEELREAMRDQRIEILEDLEAKGVDVSSWSVEAASDGDATRDATDSH